MEVRVVDCKLITFTQKNKSLTNAPATALQFLFLYYFAKTTKDSIGDSHHNGILLLCSKIGREGGREEEEGAMDNIDKGDLQKLEKEGFFSSE
jgi:hypothetical protein